MGKVRRRQMQNKGALCRPRLLLIGQRAPRRHRRRRLHHGHGHGQVAAAVAARLRRVWRFGGPDVIDAHRVPRTVRIHRFPTASEISWLENLDSHSKANGVASGTRGSENAGKRHRGRGKRKTQCP